jgi:type II secretory ATPase GspE/PulE/Tfp pilus assembly ATPase PilB-like protein
MIDDLKGIPSKVNLEQFDVSAFSKDKIRELFKTGKVPTAEAMVDEIILRAVKAGATDLHFEPAETELRIRIGSEGVIKKLIHLPKEISENLSSVLKTKGTLNAFEKKKPQEGRFSINIGMHQYDIRVATVPVMFGERIALRILEKNAKVTDLEELGFSPSNLDKIRKLIRRSSGLFIVSGPASSGKSTTIYAAVNDIQSEEKNIITVENPIEYKLDYASQVSTPADKTFTFADALRSILRQNPNIIMLGEIRDVETGVVAAEAALTGNLVLSTILANDSVGAIFRLLSMGVPPFWLASTLIGVVHQLLVRKICPHCKEEFQPSEIEKGSLMSVLTTQAKFFRGRGCDNCRGSGYIGRTAIHEILIINDEIRDLIYKNESLVKIKEAARSAGFENIFEDAIAKVGAGITSISELSRTIG